MKPLDREIEPITVGLMKWEFPPALLGRHAKFDSSGSTFPRAASAGRGRHRFRVKYDESPPGRTPSEYVLVHSSVRLLPDSRTLHP